MPDIRIKDLTTTASTTAADDFFAADGTTNGTRKLSAYSPTFGGNATVGGALVANGLLSAAGSSTLDGLPTSAVFGGTKRVVAGYSTSSDYGFLASVDNGVGWKDLWLNPSGGSIKAGGQLIQVADPATIALWKDSTPTKAARFQFNTLADNGFSLGVYDGSSWLNAITAAPTTGVVKVPSTSASTTTSSGALVVGGGVGVAGNVCMGGDLSIQADKGIYQKQGNVHKWTSDGASTGTARADIYADSSGVLFFRTNGATEALSLNASQTAQFAGAVVANAASGAFRIANSQTPASATATGTAGTIAWDTSYIYVCTATNTWKRAAISTW